MCINVGDRQRLPVNSCWSNDSQACMVYPSSTFLQQHIPTQSLEAIQVLCIPVHPPYSSGFVTEFNPEYRNADLLIWLVKLELCRTWPAVTPPTLLELCRYWSAVTSPTLF